MRSITFVVATFLLCGLQPLSAQNPSLQDAPRELCFRGQPLPTCKSFWIFEAGYVYWLNGHWDHHTAVWDLGLMANANERLAFGATFFAVAGGGQDPRVGLKARFRRWLNHSTSVEASPGVLLLGGYGEGPGLIGHVSLNFQDRLALTGQFEAEDGRGVDWYAGLRLGSTPALIGIAAEAAAVAAVFIACLVGDCWSS